MCSLWRIKSFWLEYRKRRRFLYLCLYYPRNVNVRLDWSPLIKLNFNKEKLNGDYRYSLIRVRDNAESIAFYQGELQEQHLLKNKFAQIIHNRWAIVLRMLGLDGFNGSVTRVAKLLPLMLQAPRFLPDKSNWAICTKLCKHLTD